MSRISRITRWSLVLVCVAGASLAVPACVDDPDDRAPDIQGPGPIEPGEITLQPSCAPGLDSEGGLDDGEHCDAENTEPDVICDRIPHPDPDLYCVICGSGPSECMPYPPLDPDEYGTPGLPGPI